MLKFLRTEIDFFNQQFIQIIEKLADRQIIIKLLKLINQLVPIKRANYLSQIYIFKYKNTSIYFFFRLYLEDFMDISASLTALTLNGAIRGNKNASYSVRLKYEYIRVCVCA